MDSKYMDLAQKLAGVLSDTVSAKFILHGYHWNVLGPDFGEYHEFFGTLYSDVDGSIDPLAENILKLGYPAPYLLADFLEMSSINEERLDGTSSQFLLQSALRIMESLENSHTEAFHIAEAHDKQGLMDFLAGRIDMYARWVWQIKAFLGVR
jgi:starvation-inducible DNA-binding protein